MFHFFFQNISIISNKIDDGVTEFRVGVLYPIDSFLRPLIVSSLQDKTDIPSKMVTMNPEFKNCSDSPKIEPVGSSDCIKYKD